MTTPCYDIRTARLEDLDAILEITIREFEAVASIDARIQAMIGGVTWERIKRISVSHELQTDPDACAVAVSEGAIIGYVTNTVNLEASRGIIANLAVSANCQGRGIGRRLIEWSLNCFRTRGLRQAKIETLEANAAGRHLYPAMGFQEVVRQVHYIMKLSDD